MKRYSITVNGVAYDVQVQELGAGAPAAPVPASAAAPAPAPIAAPASGPAGVLGAIKVEAPMPGSILDIKASVGQQVVFGDVLVVLEAMKMENDIVAPAAGTVAGVHVGKGDTVDTGALLVSLS